MLSPLVLQASMPTILPPYPPLDTIFKPYHIPTPFCPSQSSGMGARLHADGGFLHLEQRIQDQRQRRKVDNIHTNKWEEPDAVEKETLLGFQRGETVASGISKEQRAIRLGRALAGTIVRWLGVFLHASQA